MEANYWWTLQKNITSILEKAFIVQKDHQIHDSNNEAAAVHFKPWP